jgi:hypothetical protein
MVFAMKSFILPASRNAKISAQVQPKPGLGEAIGAKIQQVTGKKPCGACKGIQRAITRAERAARRLIGQGSET